MKLLDFLDVRRVHTETRVDHYQVITIRRNVRPLRAAVKCVKCDGCSDRCFDPIFCSSGIWPVRDVGPPPPPGLLEMDPSGAIQ